MWCGEVAGSVPIPAVAIAGITADNVDDVVKSGVQAVAVTAAVCAAEDPRKAAEELKKRIVDTAGGQDRMSVIL